MTPQLGGTLEILQVDLAGRQLRLVLERRGPPGMPLWLLLPALSTVSSRGEWQALAEAVGERHQLAPGPCPSPADHRMDSIRAVTVAPGVRNGSNQICLRPYQISDPRATAHSTPASPAAVSQRPQLENPRASTPWPPDALACWRGQSCDAALWPAAQLPRQRAQRTCR